MRIEVHPTDPQLSTIDFDYLVRVLPDPESTDRDLVEVSISRQERVITARDLVEIPNDARGLPLPGEIVYSTTVWKFSRRTKPDGSRFWYRLP